MAAGTFSVSAVNVACGLPNICSPEMRTFPLAVRATWLPCPWDQVQSRNGKVRGNPGSTPVTSCQLICSTCEPTGQGSQLVAKEGQLMTHGENTGLLPGLALTSYLVPGRLCERNHRA